MTEEKELNELAKQMLKGGLMLAESTEELAKNYSGPQVENSIIETAGVMIDNCKTDDRKMRIASLTHRMGQRMESDTLQEYGAKQVQKIDQEAQ